MTITVGDLGTQVSYRSGEIQVTHKFPEARACIGKLLGWLCATNRARRWSGACGLLVSGARCAGL